MIQGGGKREDDVKWRVGEGVDATRDRRGKWEG